MPASKASAEATLPSQSEYTVVSINSGKSVTASTFKTQNQQQPSQMRTMPYRQYWKNQIVDKDNAFSHVDGYSHKCIIYNISIWIISLQQ